MLYGFKGLDMKIVNEMRTFRWTSGVTRRRNKYVRGSIRVSSTVDKMKDLEWVRSCYEVRRFESSKDGL